MTPAGAAPGLAAGVAPTSARRALYRRAAAAGVPCRPGVVRCCRRGVGADRCGPSGSLSRARGGGEGGRACAHHGVGSKEARR